MSARKKRNGIGSDPRWREVLRLLVAGYAQEAQLFLFQSILDRAGSDANVAQLLGGLLLDGVASALVHKEEVIRILLLASASATDSGVLRNTLAILRACREKTDGKWEAFESALHLLCSDAEAESARTCLRLAAISSDMDLQGALRLCGPGPARETALLSLFGAGPLTLSDLDVLHADLDLLWTAQHAAARESPGMNRLACALQSLASGNRLLTARRGFDVLLSILGCGVDSGPFLHFACNLLLFSPDKAALRFGIMALRGGLRPHMREIPIPTRAMCGPPSVPLDRALALDRARGSALQRAVGADLSTLEDARHLLAHAPPDNASAVWATLIANPEVARGITEFLCVVFDLKPAPLWNETLVVLFLPTVPGRVSLVDPSWWRETRTVFDRGKPVEADVFAAGCQLIFDAMLRVVGYYEPDADWLRRSVGYTGEQVEEHRSAAKEWQKLFADLANLTRQREEAPLRIAHCVRDLFYGDQSRIEELTRMVESRDSAFREIFERCYWRRTEEEARREEEDR